MDMTGDHASNWEFFKHSWKNYATATKLDQKDEEVVAATLLSIMGKECLHVCRNLPMTEEEREDADVILTKLERYVFNCRSQKPGESFDQFLTELRKYAATCQLGTFEDEMLRDRIVTDLRAHGHRERLLRGTTLTLQKAIDICRTNEMAASQRVKMEQTDTVHLVHVNRTRARHADPRKIKNCKYCGDSRAAGNCPAFEKTCTKCNKKIILQKSVAPPPNTVMGNQRGNLKMSASE